MTWMTSSMSRIAIEEALDEVQALFAAREPVSGCAG